MAIAFQCDCGKAYSVPDEFAARRTKCKACGVALTVPAAAPAGDDFEVVEGPPPPPRGPGGQVGRGRGRRAGAQAA